MNVKAKRRRGRPKIENPQDDQVHFRCTKADKARWKKAAGKTDLSEWLKALADKASEQNES